MGAWATEETSLTVDPQSFPGSIYFGRALLAVDALVHEPAIEMLELVLDFDIVE